LLILVLLRHLPMDSKFPVRVLFAPRTVVRHRQIAQCAAGFRGSSLTAVSEAQPLPKTASRKAVDSLPR
jgi:hypothetical protein